MIPLRISCAGFGILQIKDRFLVCHDETKGWSSFFGGAYHYNAEIAHIIDAFRIDHSYNSQKRKKADRRDIRLVIAAVDEDAFFQWFNSKKGRELEPRRELVEELIKEEKLIDYSHGNFSLYYMASLRHHDTNQTPSCSYHWDYFKVELTSPNAEKFLLSRVQGHPRAHFVTLDDIERGKTLDGRVIAYSVQNIRRFLQ